MAVVKKLPSNQSKRRVDTGGGFTKSKLIEIDLPTAPKNQEESITKYAGLIYGREKIGKTTILSSFPGAIFFCCEPGAKGLSIYEFNSENGGVHNWNIFRTGVSQLCKPENKGKFQTVIIDTADRAYEMCLDWVCKNRGVEYPGQDSDGKEDFGKSWKAVKGEFIEQIHHLLQAGLGIWFTSHAKETEIKTKSGARYDKIYPTMSSQARAVIEALVDFYFYAEYVQGPDNKTIRILVCEGDETLWAGGRPTPFIQQWPRFLPMTNDGTAFDIIQSAFKGEYIGLDPSTMLPARSTSKVASKLLVDARESKKREGLKKIIKKIN
jgi:hypothetical protein